MKEDIINYLPWIISIIAIYKTWMIGNKDRMGWAIAIFNQCLWLSWLIASESWGLLPLNAAMWIVSIRNFGKWREEDLEKKPMTERVVKPGADAVQRIIGYILRHATMIYKYEITSEVKGQVDDVSRHKIAIEIDCYTDAHRTVPVDGTYTIRGSIPKHKVVMKYKDETPR